MTRRRGWLIIHAVIGAIVGGFALVAAAGASSMYWESMDGLPLVLIGTLGIWTAMSLVLPVRAPARRRAAHHGQPVSTPTQTQHHERS